MAAVTQSNRRAEPGFCVSAVKFDKRFLNLSWTWLNDPEIRRLLMVPAFTKEQQVNWFAELDSRVDYLIWGIERDGEPIGAFGIKNIDGACGEYWGYIGEKRYWGQGIGRWMVNEAIKRAKEVGIKRLCLKVSQENARAIALYRACGFKMQSTADEVLWMEREI